jgi:transcription antitermination factor NusG
MNPNNLPNWYVVYTKPRWEKKVAELLRQKGIENFCPLNRKLRQWHDRKKTILEPLFTSYVFVQATTEEHSKIRKINGIINFVSWLSKPAIVRPEEIIAIKNFLNHHSQITLEKIQVDINDTVRITHGPLMHQEGRVLEVLNHTIRIILPSLGYAMTARISREHVERTDYAFGEKTTFFPMNKAI